MARLYTNENFPRPSVEALRELGHDVLTTAEAGKADQRIPDEEVLAFAMENERILVTFNRKDFIRLHNEKQTHGGIIVCTVDADFPALAQRIHAALTAQSDLAGQLIRVNRPNRL